MDVADHDDLQAVELATVDGDEVLLSAVWVPGVGAVGLSLRHRGDELLGMRGGLAAYLADAKTFGIPLLAPWANRLDGDTYRVGDVEVSVTGVPGVHRDANGLPIHGLLGAAQGWQVRTLNADSAGAHLEMAFSFDADRPEFAAFPFPHELTVTVDLVGTEMTVTTGLTATSDEAVPVAFGWHPYFTIPGVPRTQWEVQAPFTDRVVLDERAVPTGEIEVVDPLTGPLGTRELDDLYCAVVAGSEASVAGNGRRISLVYVAGYDYAVLYAPDEADLIAIEPMTAPTDPFAGKFDTQFAAPGGRYLATYHVRITELAEDN